MIKLLMPRRYLNSDERAARDEVFLIGSYLIFPTTAHRDDSLTNKIFNRMFLLILHSYE